MQSKFGYFFGFSLPYAYLCSVNDVKKCRLFTDDSTGDYQIHGVAAE